MLCGWAQARSHPWLAALTDGLHLGAVLQEAIISHGCTVKSSSISSAVVGLRSHIEEGCTIDVSICCAAERKLCRLYALLL
jgi:hypothetical protein